MHLETARTIIREFTPGDLDDLQEIFGDGKTTKNCESPFSEEKTLRFLNTFCIEKHGALACVHRESEKLIGYILFNEFDPGIYEMGWIFHRAFWRQGFAYETCKALLDHAFDVLHAHKVFAETIDSVRSVELMKKLGMKLEGIQRQQTMDNEGNWADLYLYGMLNTDR